MSRLRVLLAVLGALVAGAVVVGAVLAFTTFVTGAPAAAPASGAGPTAPSATPSGAPADFTGRTPFRSCGAVRLAAGRPIPASRIGCLVGSPATGRELVVASTSARGDRTVRYLRAGPGVRGIEIFEDRTEGSSTGWSHRVCASGRVDQFGSCA